MALPGKLWKLKEWLTVPEAARHLSIMFGEEVNETDVLRLALDGHLKLSINFVNGTSARRGGNFLPFDEWEKEFRSNNLWDDLKPIELKDKKIGCYFPGYDGVIVHPDAPTVTDSTNYFMQPEALKNDYLNKCSPDQKTAILDAAIDAFVGFAKMQAEKFGGKVPPSFDSFRGEVISIRDVWDIPMLGTELIDIEHKYQQLTGGPEVTLCCMDGPVVEGKNGELYQLQESMDDNEYQSGSKAQLRKIKENIAINKIKKSKAEELLKQHKQDREKYLKARDSKKHSDDYYPAGGLPEDGVLVVRTSALTDLQVRLEKESEAEANGKATVKDGIGNKERGTWLKIIYLLADKLADTNRTAYLKNDGTFNLSKFEEVLKDQAADLLGNDARMGNIGHGLSNDNLKKIFDEAKKLF
ncbi:MAG: hypothetical protein PHI06_02740 [Desulfobulbaceae bacterium]|nr:hypothetical protein [Desulfobulbaceae bacterium]